MTPDSDRQDSFVSPARVRLTAAVRHLIDGVLTAEEPSDAQLEATAELVERAARQLNGRDQLDSRPSGVRRRELRTHHDYLPRSPLVGITSPLAPPIEYRYRHGRLTGTGRFSAAYEGPPGYVHGGWIALAFDELLGMANVASGHPGMTGRLTVRYRRPTPLHTDVRFETWTETVDGRRIVTRGTLTVEGTVTADAEGLFVTLHPEQAAEYFGERAYEDRPAADPLP